MARKSFVFVVMDPPYESARSVSAYRLMDAAVRKGHDVFVFAYEGGVSQPFAKQAQHPNSVHGRDTTQEDHPLPKDWIAALQAEAKKRGTRFQWMNCGLCVDERGVAETIPDVVRGSPAELWKAAEAADNILVMGAS